ncbi:MAG: hypothetical protein JO193_02200, partial [Candidatus Eremiobacteraeota bacterium]|nr:hypothetical protein [Candidatus Eremiobacteraeota bacterium]
PVDSALAHRVTDEIKRLREERARSAKSVQTIEVYQAAMKQLSISEPEVIDIALAIGNPQAVAI